MAGTNILVRQKDLIAGAGISITPDTTSGNVTIASTNASIDESRLVPTGGKGGDILSYQEGADRGNGDNVRLLLQNALTDSANGNAAPAAVTTQGVTLTDANDLLFDGNDSHVTAVLATDEIFAADKEWTIDFWMKPTANSSEWNYILTENTGDWGSHSIGLTWNSDDSTLEQDTGGYLASVIRSSNWPNDAVACAADQWHFVAVEKQKTSTGWSLNYYLNGAIWLQVAFTGEFVPFTSDNPFWFGGKTTDSGRWFKGEANKLRVTAGARYGGKAFAVPDRLTDYAAPAGQPVWTEGIDRSRLLPENPANGDIPCYNATATTGGGNDVNTKVLLHFDELPFADTAAGNASPAAVTNSGVTLDTENFKFGTASAKFANSSNNLKVAVPQAQMMASPWLADCWFKVDDGQWNEYRRIFTQDDEQNGGWTYYLMSSNRVGVWVRGITPNEPASAALTPGDWHYAALVYYNAKFYGFIDGVRFTVQDGSAEGFLNYIMLGKRIQSTSYSLRGNIDEFRFQLLDEAEIGKWTGTTIPVPTAPYSIQETAGEWGKLNKSELVQSVNGVTPDESGNVVLDASTIIDNSRLLPVLDTLPEGYEGSLLAVQRGDGKVADENTLRLMHFNDDVRDVVTDETGTLKGNASITPTGYFAGALSINHAVVSSLSFNGLTATPTAWTMDFRVKLGRFSGNAPLVLIGTNLNETQTSLIRVDSSYVDIQATYNQRVIYKTHSLQLDTWYHFALTYDGTTYKFYIDGTLFGTGESTNQFDFTRKLWFGSFYDYSTSYVSDCTIDEFRLSNVVRWTENFTPPDKPYGESLYNWGIGPKLDESRLLPEEAEANNLVIKRVGDTGIDGNTHLMLHFDEESGAPVDSSQSGLSVTANSTTTTTAGKFNKALNLNDSYLSLTCSAMSTGSGDFTYDGWFYFNELSTRRGLFGVNWGIYVALWGDNTFGVSMSTTGSSWTYNYLDSNRSEVTATQGVWHHIALVRHKGNVTLYLNGTSILSFDIGESTVLTGKLGTDPFYIGYPLGGMSYVADFVDEFRFSTVARWTENFTPPEKAYSTSAESWDPISLEELRDELAPTGVITTGSDRILPDTAGVSSDSVGNPVIFKAISRIDNTYWLCLPLNEDTSDRSTYDVATGVYGTVNIVSNAPSSPGGSAFFNGSSCLHGTLPAQFGTSDFTVRFWMMAPAMSGSSSSHTLFSTRNGDETSGNTFGILCTGDGHLFVYSNGNVTSRSDTPFTLQSNVWYHIAVVRKEGVLTIYVNGSVYASGTFTNELTRQIFGIGASWTGSSYSEAGTVYLTSLDVLNYAAYDGAFTTPAYQPGTLAGMGYKVATDSEVTDMLSAAGIDESRLLPELATIPEELSGHPVVYDYQSGIDADTLCLLHLDDSTWADATGKNTITQHGSEGKVADNGYFDKALDLTANSSGAPDWLTVPWLAEYEAATWTMEFFAKPTKSVVNFMFFSFGNSQGSYLSLGSQSLTNLWLGNGSGTYTGNFSFSLNTWYWFVIQYDGSAVKVYVDGQLVVQGNFTPNYVGQDLQFGNLNLVENSDNTFIGYLDEFRWSKGLRYPTGGMIAPTEPYGTPAKSYKVSKADLVFSDSPRLLPENPANGDIPCYSNEPPVGVNYNDANTVLLLQGSSDNTAAAATSERLNGIVTGEFPVQEDGSILVNGTSNYITFNDADARRVFSGEFTLETYIKTTQFTASGKRHDTNWCVVYRNDTSSVTAYQWLLLSDFYADAGKFGIWPYPQMSGETFPKTLVNAEFQHVAIDVYMVDGVRKFTMYRNGVPYHTGNYWSTTPADWSSGVSAAMRLFGEGPSGGDDYLSNASVMSLRVSNVARYKGVSFDPPADGKYLNPPAGYWGKLNKAELVKSVNGQTPDSSGAVTLPEATTSAAGLMSATDREKSIGLTTRGFYPNAPAKSGAVDFNEVIDHGFYFIGGDTPHLNYPETYQQNGGTLQVIRNGNYLTQTFIPLNINKVFIRTCMNALSDSSVRTFSAWRRALTAPDITESKTSSGYFKLPGGTIVQWGEQQVTAGSYTKVVFPIVFPTAFVSGTAIVYEADVEGSVGGYDLAVSIGGGTVSGMSVYAHGDSVGIGAIPAKFIAIGY